MLVCTNALKLSTNICMLPLAADKNVRAPLLWKNLCRLHRFLDIYVPTAPMLSSWERFQVLLAILSNHPMLWRAEFVPHGSGIVAQIEINTGKHYGFE